jgi:hypothetical protein
MNEWLQDGPPLLSTQTEFSLEEDENFSIEIACLRHRSGSLDSKVSNNLTNII